MVLNNLLYIVVTLFGCPPCLGRSAYGIELHWIIKLISEKKRVMEKRVMEKRVMEKRVMEKRVMDR